MATLGFIIVTTLGIAALVVACMVFLGCIMFSTRLLWPPILVYGVIGIAMLWFAWEHSPIYFTVLG